MLLSAIKVRNGLCMLDVFRLGVCLGSSDTALMASVTANATTTLYVGNYYEKTSSTVRKYYYHAGRRVAMRENGVLSWLRSVSPSLLRGC